MNFLLVDDEPVVLDILVRILCRLGHTVTTASNGEEATRVFSAGAFDAVMTDLSMPGMDGLRLARFVKAVKPGQVVVLFTGAADGSMVQPHVDFVLGKPVSVGALANLLQRLEALARSPAKSPIKSPPLAA